MGLGDEILALGRAEALFEETGKQVAICNDINMPRDHSAWHGNPAWNPKSTLKIIDGAGCRPYIKSWIGRKIEFNHKYRARAGLIHLTDEEKNFAPSGDYAVIAPFIKDNASENKEYKRWDEVIENFPITVYQLVYGNDKRVIRGAKPLETPSFRLAASVISKARLVLTNEGGAHHMAASFKRPAVVVFGSFVPPYVTGYDFHENVYRETPHGYCGNWDFCLHCQKAMNSIKPEEIRERANKIMESKNV